LNHPFASTFTIKDNKEVLYKYLELPKSVRREWGKLKVVKREKSAPPFTKRYKIIMI